MSRMTATTRLRKMKEPSTMYEMKYGSARPVPQSDVRSEPRSEVRVELRSEQS